ncbi:MAG: glycosyltransferase family 39 protein [Chloroflexi bacterium]|nr:glycosyltransferase family 39 protein [Chloroflexota bacterium]
MTQAQITITQPTSGITKTGALPLSLKWSTAALIVIAIIALGMRLVDMDAFGDGNTYYTAAVANMLESPSNFFYAVADAGGVTVDKPPVALWIQAAFAAVLGVSGFSVTLPSVIAGTLSVVLLYHLVQKGFGRVAGLIAAFVLAITPISVAVDRTNNLDSILIFFLMLATWAFVRAVEIGKWRHLLLGAILVGVAFNVKMLQAYLILPALYAVYFFAANVTWRRKVVQLSVATGVLLAVSLSWAVAVDLTPADQRPFIGGSEDNSVIDLAFGYNGVDRLLGSDDSRGANSAGGAPSLPDRDAVPQAQLAQPLQALDDAGSPPTGGPGGSDEIGEAGVARLFETALANELAWLLPFGLLSIGLLAFRSRIELPLTQPHQAAMLWGGWLVTGVVFFSVSSFFHAYYLATLAPALAALTGIGVVVLWEFIREYRSVGIPLALGILVTTLAFQIYVVSLYEVEMLTFVVPVVLAGMVLGTGLALALWRNQVHRVALLSAGAFVVALLAIPSLWGLETALESSGNLALPAAYPGDTNTDVVGPGGSSQETTQALDTLVDYISASGSSTSYDLVVDSSMIGAQIILGTNLDVLYLGGFNGEDQIYTAEALESMVEEGEISFVLSSGGQPEISSWLVESCTEVDEIILDLRGAGAGGPLSGQMPSQGGPPMPPAGDGPPPAGPRAPGLGEMPTLYDCGIQ